MKREFIVGVVFALLLGLLVLATIWVEKPGFFKSRKPFAMVTRFHEVAGLTEGSEVWVYGTSAGRVKSIKPDGTGNVRVALEMDYDPEMHENAEVKIAQRSALGGSIVSIHPGTPDSPRSVKDVYDGRSVKDAFQEISDAVSELKGPIKDTVNQMNKVFTDIGKHSDTIAANLDKTIANTESVTRDIREHKGTLGKLLDENDTLYADLKDAVASLKKIGDDANGGGGTIDLLLHDKTASADMKQTMSNIRTLSDDLVAGKGTLGKLFKDDSLFTRMDNAFNEFGALAADARSGKGALGKLIYDPEIARRIDAITANVENVTGKINRGEGTLGKLINDDTVYNDLKSTLKKLGGGADDVRENAPVLTFAGFLFSGF